MTGTSVEHVDLRSLRQIQTSRKFQIDAGVEGGVRICKAGLRFLEGGEPAALNGPAFFDLCAMIQPPNGASYSFVAFISPSAPSPPFLCPPLESLFPTPAGRNVDVLARGQVLVERRWLRAPSAARPVQRDDTTFLLQLLRPGPAGPV